MYLPHRKPNRLPGYDYGQNGAYFITICTKNKQPILGKCVPGDPYNPPFVLLSQEGQIVEYYLQRICGMDKYIIMPNHVHMILLTEKPPGKSTTQSPVSQRIQSFKTLVTKNIQGSIFQRSYHDHIIRNDADYQRIWQYIDTNPTKWQLDCFYCDESPSVVSPTT